MSFASLKESKQRVCWSGLILVLNLEGKAMLDGLTVKVLFEVL
jgi:hypothetical protein